MSVNIAQGLTKSQYNQNIVKFGLNKLPEAPPPSRFSIFISQFKNPIVSILLIAALMTVGVQILDPHIANVDFTEFFGIMIVVFINGILGYIQENQAEATLQSLTSSVKSTTRVIREGLLQEVNTDSLTVGDIVELKLGDKVPADGIILKGTDISADESVLTGESEAVVKAQFDSKTEFEFDQSHRYPENNYLYMGTSVMSGIGRIVVTQIGTQTKFGQIANSLATEETVDTPLQVKLRSFTKQLTYFIGFISVLIVIWGVIDKMSLVEILELAISIAVSSIPEGLVVALTVILALGMRRILQRKAVVRKLVAAETLGSVDTICIDKTGTLTEGRMQVAQTFFTDDSIAKRALMATNHQINSVEIAALDWLKHNLTAKEEVELTQEEHLEFKIFDSTTKYSATKSSEFTYYVGAPEIILQSSNLNSESREHWKKEIQQFSIKGMRLIALGYIKTSNTSFSSSSIPQGIEWLGLIVIEDPIRPGLKQVFDQAAEAGISVKVITGDYGETARAVMNKIGIQLKPSEMISGADLAKLTERELLTRIPKLKLFYRTTPNQKLQIIKALQSKGHVVAMMGDGINDTPALKKAEIGIVVNNATDFSKEVADMVLIDSNFKTIIAAIEEGRNIFESFRRVLAYLLADAFDAVVIVLGSLVLGVPVPLLPLQILYINFVADGIPDISLSFEKPEHEVMKEPPRKKNYPLIDSEVRAMVVTIGLVVSIAVLILYLVLLDQGVPQDYARSLIMLTVGMNSLIYIFPIKSFRKNIWHINIFDNRLMLAGVGFGILSLVAAVHLPFLQNLLETVPIIASDWIIVIGIALADVLLIELVKSIYIQRSHTHK